METTSPKDPFTGPWKLLGFPALQLDIAFDGQGYAARMAGLEPMPLEKDEWNNLQGDGVCLSLHGRNGKLFGLQQTAGGSYATLAATREQSSALRNPACGLDWDAFGQMVGKSFTLRAMQASMPVPVGPDDQIRIEKIVLPGGEPSYQIGAFRDGRFVSFDDLCPDRANGTLNSRQFGTKQTLRNVSLWQDKRGAGLRIFSMVAIGAEALEYIESRGGQDEDPFVLGEQLSLLPAEVRCLMAMVKASSLGPGDPMIVWGADDGGG